MKKMTNKIWAFGLVSVMLLSGCGAEPDIEPTPLADLAEEIVPQEPEVVEEPEVEEEPEEVIPEPVVVDTLISLAGDCSLGKLSVHGYEGTFYQQFDLNGPGYFFSNVLPYFEEDDMTLVNFEGVLTTSNDIVEKQYNIKGEPEFKQILVEGNIEAVSFGNNHRIDYGEQGVTDTIAAFNEIGVPYAYDEYLGYYETEEGIMVGYVSVNQVYDGEAVEVFLEDGIKKLKEDGCNIVLACCHWGDEGTHRQNAYQMELGRKCVDWGADLVVGCHPHVLQGIDYYNGKYIIYSLGNFCFGGNRNPKDKNSMIVQASFHTTDGVIDEPVSLKIVPCTISSVMDRNDYCPTPATGDRYKEIINNLNSYSSAFSVTIDEEGQVIPPVTEEPEEIPETSEETQETE